MVKYNVFVYASPKNSGFEKCDVGVGCYVVEVRGVEFPEKVSEGRRVDLLLKDTRTPNFTLTALAKKVGDDSFNLVRNAETSEEWLQLVGDIGDCPQLDFYARG